METLTGRLRRLPEVFENFSNRHRLGDKSDESYLATAVVASQGKGLVDTCHEHGPLTTQQISAFLLI